MVVANSASEFENKLSEYFYKLQADGQEVEAKYFISSNGNLDGFTYHAILEVR